MRKRIGFNAAGALAITAGMLLIAAPAASAHDNSIEGPTSCGPVNIQACGEGGVQQSHTKIWARDLIADGHGYYIEYQLRSGAIGQVGDANGSAAGDGSRVVTTTSNPVTQFRGCGDGIAGGADICTPWATA